MDGAVAQLGERLNGIQKVVGSIPISSTKFLFRPEMGPLGASMFPELIQIALPTANVLVQQ